MAAGGNYTRKSAAETGFGSADRNLESNRRGQEVLLENEPS
jgi:hypothetical protein